MAAFLYFAALLHDNLYGYFFSSREPCKRYRHGQGDGTVLQEQHSGTGRSVDAGTGKPEYTGSPLTPRIIRHHLYPLKLQYGNPPAARLGDFHVMALVV